MSENDIRHLYCPYCKEFEATEAKSHTAACGKTTTGPMLEIKEDSLICAICVDILAQRHEGTLPQIQCVDCGMMW